MDIGAWLQGLGLERYVPAFRENEIDWAVLPKLTSDDLREIGVAAIGHRRKLLEAIAAIGAMLPTAASAAVNAPAPADAERRQLTIMFCDLVDSTPLALRFDPESRRGIQMPTQDRQQAEGDREAELAIVRRAYAKHVLANADVDDERVEAAFAAVRREDFLGPGPWPILRWPHRYVLTPSNDPVYLYQDALVGIIPERSLNDGQPWLHAMLIAAAAPRAGQHVVHVGAGVGYYTAILAHMVGESGRVTAIEYDPGLAERLGANFAGQPNVRALQADGAQIEFDPADVIYVKRTLGQGCRTRGLGRNASASFTICVHTSLAFWLRRHSRRCQRMTTW